MVGREGFEAAVLRLQPPLLKHYLKKSGMEVAKVAKKTADQTLSK
jgi:hypothetical protein